MLLEKNNKLLSVVLTCSLVFLLEVVKYFFRNPTVLLFFLIDLFYLRPFIELRFIKCALKEERKDECRS